MMASPWKQLCCRPQVGLEWRQGHWARGLAGGDTVFVVLAYLSQEDVNMRPKPWSALISPEEVGKCLPKNLDVQTSIIQ